MKRLFILVPDLKETSDIAHELAAGGIKESHIHVHGHVPQEVRDAHLHPANVFQTTHLGNALKYGLILGLVFSAAIFGLCLFFFPPSIQIHVLGYAAIFVFGVGFGIWSAGLVGLGIKEKVLEQNEKYVSDGHYVMMVDAKNDKEIEIAAKIQATHPTASLAVAIDRLH